MRQKIAKLNKDIFDDRTSGIEFSTTSIFFTVNPNESFSGGFTISSKDNKNIRGIIYTSTFRMQLRTNAFDSKNVYIPFTFNASGLVPGAKLTGKFIVLTEVGEYEINFCASVNMITIESKYGSFSTLEEFKELAYNNYEAAFKAFISKKFVDIIPDSKDDIKNLYYGLGRFEIDMHAMEEFLISIGLKSSIQISLLGTEKQYFDLEESVIDGVDIIKNDWGYLPIEVKINGDFVQCEITKFSTLDFDENKYRLEYTIDINKLHEGKNFSTLSITTPYETKHVEIVVTKKKSSVTQETYQKIKDIKILSTELIKNYILFKNNKIDGTMLKNLSIPKLEELYDISDHYPIYKMIEAQLYKDAMEYDDAKKILEEFGRDFWAQDKNNILWAYYLYIAATLKDDISYTIKADDEVSKIYKKNDKSWELLWIKLQLENVMIQDTDKRFEQLEKHWEDGNFHTLLYLEAYLLIKEQPSMIEHLDDFMLNVLVFAKRHGILTEDIARYIAMVSNRIYKYNARIFELLSACYGVLPNKDVLSAICKYLIACHMSDPQYFEWFEKGINEGLHISNLYEFYMYSLDDTKDIVIPHSVYLYFTRPNTLDYRKKAYIYSDIVAEKAKFPEIYDRIEKDIIEFTKEQLRATHISRHLKILYNEFLFKFKLGREENRALADLYYTYEISTDALNLSQVIVLHKGLISPSVVTIINGKALVKLYTRDDKILLQDKTGKVFIKTIPYKVTKCFGDEHFREYVRVNSPRHIGVLLSTTYTKVITADNLAWYNELLDIDSVQEYAKRQVKKALLWYYYETDNHAGVAQYISHIPLNNLNKSERSLYFGILLGENRLKSAFELIKDYGYEGIDMELLLDFCDQYLSATAFEEDIILSELAMHLFRLDITSDNILKYLEEVYCGTTDSMIEVWEAVHGNGKTTSHIEERILIQMLFCEEVTDEGDIFDSYYRIGKNKILKRAYISYKAYKYFAYNNELESRFFDYISNEYKTSSKINTSWELASLKYYSDKDKSDSDTLKMLDDFMADCANNNLVFSFFRNYPKEMLNKYSLTNRYVVSYQSSGKSKIIIRYVITREGVHVGEYKEEVMPPHYYTHFLKEFILFKGEELRYYLIEETMDKTRIVEAQCVKPEDNGTLGTGRFGAINEILTSDIPEIKLEEYEKKNYLVNQLFQIQ